MFSSLLLSNLSKEVLLACLSTMPSLGLSARKESLCVFEKEDVLEGSFENEPRLYSFFKELLFWVDNPDSYF